MKDYYSEERFSNIDQTEIFARKTTFEPCTFDTCSFQNVDISGCKFLDCQFSDCDLSNIKVLEAAFQEVHFSSCKMIGIQFDTINPLLFEVSFTSCILDHASFHNIAVNSFKAEKCSLQHVDFSEAKLKGSSWTESNLLGATFDQTILTGADFRQSSNLRLNPNQNQIRRARFSQDALPGLLVDFDIIIE